MGKTESLILPITTVTKPSIAQNVHSDLCTTEKNYSDYYYA